MGRSRDLDKVHLAVPNHFIGKVLLDVNVLGPPTSPQDVVTPFYSRSNVLAHRYWHLLGKSQSVQKIKRRAQRY